MSHSLVVCVNGVVVVIQVIQVVSLATSVLTLS